MLEIRILQPTDQPALEAFLVPRIASSMFLVSNSRAAGLRDDGRPLQGTYAAAFREGAMVGVVQHTRNGHALLQAPEHAVELCRTALRESRRPLAGLLGPEAQVAAVLRAQGIERAALQLDSVESVFQLSLTRLIEPGRPARLSRARLRTHW